MRELERRSNTGSGRLPREATEVKTPLRPDVWESMLARHPDRSLAEWASRGIRRGFRVGFQGQRDNLKAAWQNLSSAKKHPQVMEKYLLEEKRSGRVIAVGRVDQTAKLGVLCSPFGVIPKKGKVGKWQLIVDLSSPAGHSINDGIDGGLSSLSYTSVDDVMRRVLELGWGALMAKADIKQAEQGV